MRLYYKCWYRLSYADSYLIWYSNDTDGVFVDPNGIVLSFRSIDAVRIFAEERGIAVENEEPILHNLDIVKRWLDKPKTSTVDCVEFLAAWNLFGDVAHSINDNTASVFLKNEKMGNKLYDKLFWGNNLPAMTPEGHSYIPLWTNVQIELIQEILTNGLNMFEKSILVYS